MDIASVVSILILRIYFNFAIMVDSFIESGHSDMSINKMLKSDDIFFDVLEYTSKRFRKYVTLIVRTPLNLFLAKDITFSIL